MSLRLALGWACLFTIALATAPASAEEPGKYPGVHPRKHDGFCSGVNRFATVRPEDDAREPVGAEGAPLETAVQPGRALPDVDPVREMVFSFSNDRLYRIAVYYDRTRTAGLTHDDIILALKGVYGAPLASAARAERAGAARAG